MMLRISSQTDDEVAGDWGLITFTACIALCRVL